MLNKLEEHIPSLEVMAEYKKYQFETDEDLKGNTEAKKEMDLAFFNVKVSQKMMDWLQGELKK